MRVVYKYRRHVGYNSISWLVQVGVAHAAGEEAMERPAMDTRREGRHCSRVKMAFQEGAVIAESR